MSVGKIMPAWVAMETKNLTPCNEGTVCSCTNRSEIVLDKGILTSQGAMLSQLPPMFMARRAGYYTPSVMEEVAVVTAVTENKLLDPVWNDVFATVQDKEYVLKTIFTNRVLTVRVK